MKLTEEFLKKMIKEQLLNELEGLEVGKATTADVRRGAMAQAQAQTGGGLSDEERDLIRQLVTLLTQSGRRTNLLSGAVAQRLQQLIPVLQKIAGEGEPAAQGDIE